MKLWNYIFIIVTMLLFFQFLGYTTSVSGIFNFAGIGFNQTAGNQTELTNFTMSNSNFKGYLFGSDDGSTLGWFALLLGAGISAGLWASGRSDIAIKAGLATTLFVGFVSSLYMPLTKALELGISSWAVGILAMIFIPFSIGFFFALVDWVTGSAD
jgi:hypothetical protein